MLVKIVYLVQLIRSQLDGMDFVVIQVNHVVSLIHVTMVEPVSTQIPDLSVIVVALIILAITVINVSRNRSNIYFVISYEIQKNLSIAKI